MCNTYAFQIRFYVISNTKDKRKIELSSIKNIFFNFDQTDKNKFSLSFLRISHFKYKSLIFKLKKYRIT